MSKTQELLNKVDHQIRTSEVRLIDVNGNQVGIMQTAVALKQATDLGLNLIEINSKTNPPVCKIGDFGKFKFESSKHERHVRKTQKLTVIKEIKLRPKTGDHDLQFKIKNIRKFLNEGCHVRLAVTFKGRETIHPDTGVDILQRVISSISDIAVPLGTWPVGDENRLSVIVIPLTKRDN